MAQPLEQFVEIPADTIYAAERAGRTALRLIRVEEQLGANVNAPVVSVESTMLARVQAASLEAAAANRAAADARARHVSRVISFAGNRYYQ